MDTINSNDRIAATLYSLGTWFGSGIYVLIPCINEMMMMIIIIIIISNVQNRSDLLLRSGLTRRPPPNN